MSGLQRMTEGNYASLGRSLWETPVNSDLGLTLFPGSQIPTKDEKRLGITAESSPEKAGNEHHEISEQLRFFGAEIQVKNSTQETAFLNEAKSPNSPIPGSELAKLSYITADLNRERPFSEILTFENDRMAVQHNAGSADAAPCNGQQIGSSEIRNAKSCQHKSSSSRVAKWKKLGVRASNQTQGSKVTKVKEPACETPDDPFRMHYNQGLCENDTIQSGKNWLSGTGNGSKSKKPELHRQIKRSLDVAQERTFPPIISIASRSPAKHSHYPSPNLSKVLPQQLSLPPNTPAKIRAQLLKSGKRVNKRRSWTTYFPAKARFSPHTKIPDTSFLVAPFTPSQIHQHQLLINPPLTSINFHSYPTFSSTSPSDTFSNYPSLSKAFDDLISLDPLERFLNTARAGNHRQSTPRRSASMPNLWSARAPTVMGSCSNFRPASMPTPPNEMGGFSLHTRQNYAQPFTTPDVTGSSMPMDSATDAGGLQHQRQRLDMKPSYSYEDLAFLFFNVSKQAQNLKAENRILQSSNTALKKDAEGLRSEKAEMTKQIQHYECTITQKEQQNEAMRQEVMSLHKQYKQLWDTYRRALAVLRKENGTGSPSAIAQRIRQGHAPHTTGPASQGNHGNQPNANAPPVYLTNRAHLSISRPGVEQISSGIQQQVQPLSVSGVLEADIRDASNLSFQQQTCTSANHNRTNPLQTMPFSAYPEANPAVTLSRASGTPGSVASNYNNVKFSPDQPPRCMQPSIPFDAAVGAVTTGVQVGKRPVGHVSPERVTIDLTDESQPPLRLASCSESVHQTCESAVQGEHSQSNLLPGQQSPPRYPAVNRAQSLSDLSAQNQSLECQLPPSQSSQSPDREAMKIQGENIARMAKKSFSWLQGGNPFRKGTRTDQQSGALNLRQFSKGSAEGLVISTDSLKKRSVAPLPETATDRESQDKVPRKARAILTAEAKRERARGYRKKAADKKKREKEVTKQLLEAEAMSPNAMRTKAQERRATKVGKRQEQSRNPSGGVGPQERQKTLDGQLHQVDTSVRHAVPQESIEQAPSDDHDSLFGDDEDGQIEIEDSETSPEAGSAILEDDGVDHAYVAELEAQLSADADTTMWTGLEQIDTLGGGDGPIGGPCESEESEEE